MRTVISAQIDAVSSRLEGLGLIKEALWLDAVANSVDHLSSVEEEKNRALEDVHRGIAPYGIKIKEESAEETPNKTLKVEMVFDAHRLTKDDLKRLLDTALPSDGTLGVSSLYFDFQKEGMPQLTPDQLKIFVERQVPKTLRVKGVALERPETPFGVMVDTESNKVDYRDMASLLKSKYFHSVVVVGMSMEVPFKAPIDDEDQVQ